MLYLLLFFLKLILAINECSIYQTCETCAGQFDTCRWCFEADTCVASKYQCPPTKSVVHRVNCPVGILPKNFNESFNRHEVLYYIHAANRVSSLSPVGAPMSCLMKIDANITIVREIEVNETIDGWSLGYLIAINHNLKHIVVGFRSTNSVLQLLAQYFSFMLHWMDDFPLGGKMVSYYVNAYKTILNSGFDAHLSVATSAHANYEILVCGHSLGGSLATIFSLHIAMFYPSHGVDLYSWSAPRSGDETFVEMLNQHVRFQYRVVLHGDFIPDMPLRVSEVLPQPHHNTFEYYFLSSDVGDYKVCDQAESQFCLKGNWWKSPFSHIFMFNNNLLNGKLGYCK